MRQCRWKWSLSFWSHVCKTLIKPSLPPNLFLPKLSSVWVGSFEQKRQHDGFVVQRNNVQFVGQCKDDVKVADRKQLLFACPNSRTCFTSSFEGRSLESFIFVNLLGKLRYCFWYSKSSFSESAIECLLSLCGEIIVGAITSQVTPLLGRKPYTFIIGIITDNYKKRATYMAALGLKHDGSISVAPELLS